LDAAHISILNCDEMAGVRPRQPAYEIFSIKRRFQQSKSRFHRFMEPSAGGHQRLQRFRYWRWWRGVVGNAFQLKRSYRTPGPVSTAMGDYWTGTAIGFRAFRELCSNYLLNKSLTNIFLMFFFIFKFKKFFFNVLKIFNVFKCFCFIFNVTFLFFFIKNKHTKLHIWCISHGQVAFSPVFDLYNSHGYIITFSTFRSVVFTSGRFLFLTCYCAKWFSVLCIFTCFLQK